MERSLRNKVLVLALTFGLAVTMTVPVSAQGLITGDTIPAGTTYDHDAILIGEQVVIDGTVNGNVFVLGNQVTVNGTVDGSLILLGQNASIGGTVKGEVYAAALTFDVAPHALIGRDLYTAAVSLTSGSASMIGRDLYAVGLDSGLNGQVTRDLHTVIGPIQIYNGLMTLFGLDNLTIKLHFERPLPTSGSSGSLVSPGRQMRAKTLFVAAPFDWSAWIIKLLKTWAVLFIFGLLALWLGRKQVYQSHRALGLHLWQSLGAGFLVLVGGFALIVVMLLLVALIFSIGLGLNSLGLWPLTLALWVIAYASLAVASVAVWLFVVYGCKILAISFFAGWFFNKLFHKKVLWMDFLAFFFGSLIYILLLSTPYVGWVFNVLLSAFGAGAAWLALWTSRQGKFAPVAPVILPSLVKSSISPEPVALVNKIPLPVVSPLPSAPIVSPVQQVLVSLPELPETPEPPSASTGSIEKAVNSDQQPTMKMRRKKADSPTLS